MEQKSAKSGSTMGTSNSKQIRVIVDWIAKAGKADEYPKTEEGLRNLTELDLSGCGLKGASFFGLVGPN